MSKIKKITVSNLKAVSKMTASFNGCTAIITGGNNKGKTSFLRGLFDRVRGTKPDAVLKQGETEGFAEAELTTGEKIKWEFNDKGKGFKEKLTYTTDKDIRIPLTVELRNKFLPEVFDVDKFLTDPPQKQRKTLQALVGLDFTDIDTRYTAAFNSRTSKNSRYDDEKTILSSMPEPDKVEVVDLDQLMVEKSKVRSKLNDLYLANKSTNEAARKTWQAQCDDLRNNVMDFNQAQFNRQALRSRAEDAWNELEKSGYVDDNWGFGVKNWYDSLPKPEPHKVYIQPDEPKYIDEMPDDSELKAIDQRIVEASETNRNAQLYQDWLKQKEKTELHRGYADEANKLVKAIEDEKMLLIKSAKLPDGFSFSDDGIQYNGLSFTREQLSSSGIYIAALKLAAMTLGEVKALHFDASFLDKNSLSDIEAWAVSEDLQLLIERPDFEGGEIEYQLINN